MADHPIAKIVPGKGMYHSLCTLEFNLDIESGTCSVTLNDDGTSNNDKVCKYCFASYLYKKGNSYKVKEIRESEFKKIQEKYNPDRKGVVLRLGKNFDVGHKRTRSQLYQVLEYSKKYSFRPIITSKLLEYDPEISKLVIESNGIVHLSLSGRDEDETGAASQGATNRWRLAQAIKYKRHKTPVQCRIVADVTIPPTDFHEKAFNLMGGSSGILLTMLHYTKKSHFESIRKDITWDEAKTQGLFAYTSGDLRPLVQHDGWKKYREKCGTISREYCNNCVRKIDFNKHQYKQQLQQLGWGT